MRARPLALIASAAIVAMLMAGSLAPARAQVGVIGYAVMGFDHPLFQAMMAGAQEAADDLGVTLEPVDAQFDVNTQNGQLEDFISEGVSVVLVNPVTATETVPTLERVKAAGIPIVAIDTRPVGFEPDAFVTMNHYQGGYIMGWTVAGDLSCEGRWAVIWAIGNEQAASRLRGFEAGLDEACRVKGLENNFEKEGEYSGITGPLRETSREIADTLLTKYAEGELAFIFGQTDEFANGAYLATQAANREDVLIYGMDNNADMRQFLADGKNMIATTAHLAKEVGKAALQTAVNIVEGKPYLKEIQLDFRLITQDNVQFDPGWEGTYTPSFSSFLYPQQLDALYGGQQPAASGAPDEAPPATGGGLGDIASLLIAGAVILAIIVVAGIFWLRRRPAAS